MNMMKTICSGRHENCPDAPEQSVFLATGKESKYRTYENRGAKLIAVDS
jgi:hypothetical protein